MNINVKASGAKLGVGAAFALVMGILYKINKDIDERIDAHFDEEKPSEDQE